MSIYCASSDFEKTVLRVDAFDKKQNIFVTRSGRLGLTKVTSASEDVPCIILPANTRIFIGKGTENLVRWPVGNGEQAVFAKGCNILVRRAGFINQFDSSDAEATFATSFSLTELDFLLNASDVSDGLFPSTDDGRTITHVDAFKDLKMFFQNNVYTFEESEWVAVEDIPMMEDANATIPPEAK